MAKHHVKVEIEELILMGKEIQILGVLKYKKHDSVERAEEALKKLEEKLGDYKKQYHIWYARAFRCVRTLAPERLEEFERFYTGKKNMKNLTFFDAGITHYLQGLVMRSNYHDEQDYFGKFTSGMEEQINILESIKENIDDALFNIESEIHFGIFRSELDVAKELRKIKQLRAAGAVAGVVIEEHLKLSCENRNIKFRKKNVSISDYNEALKKNNHIDLVMWRLITRCADIRNYCVHSKEREPTPDEIDDVIRGAEKVISEVA